MLDVESFMRTWRAPIKVRTKTGAPSTSNIALNAIIEAGRIKAADSKEYKDIVDLNGKVVVKGKEMASNRYPSLVVLAAYAKHFKELGALKRIVESPDRTEYSLVLISVVLLLDVQHQMLTSIRMR